MPFFAPEVTTEDDALPAFLHQQCAQLRSTAHGLTTDQAVLTPTPSELSISGLLIHCAQVVHGWLTTATRSPEPTPSEMYPEISARIGIDGMYSGAEVPAETALDEILTVYDRAIAAIEPAAATIDLDTVLPGPMPPWLPEDVSITGRWVWLHLIGEVARHAGHADIIREAIDGKGSYELNFLADGGAEEGWHSPSRDPGGAQSGRREQHRTGADGGHDVGSLAHPVQPGQEPGQCR